MFLIVLTLWRGKEATKTPTNERGQIQNAQQRSKEVRGKG